MSTNLASHCEQSKHARAFACVLSFILALSLSFAPASASAEVRKADVVYGQTVDSRGLSVSQCPSIDAERAIVVSSDGTVYFERNADDQACIASITKVMTAVVALDAVSDGLVNLNTQITVTSEAAAVGESSAGLQQGDTMTLETALKALLVPSGNDAAVAIAQTVGQQFLNQGSTGSSATAAFVAKMNETATKLGCTDTVYENPHGLDFDEHAGNLHSTARDQAKVVTYAMKNQTLRSIVSGGSTTIQVTRENASASIALETTDGFLDINENAIGVKTGYTDLAGESFAGAVNKDGQELYAIVLNSSSESQRFNDADELVNWVFDHQKQYKVINSGQTTSYNGKSVPVVAEVALADWTDKTVKATVADPDAAVQIFDLNGNVSQSVEYDNVSGSVKAGKKIGTITFKQRNQVIATMDLIAAEDAPAPNAIESIGIWFDRLIKGFTGGQTVATSQLLNETPLLVDKSSSQ